MPHARPSPLSLCVLACGALSLGFLLGTVPSLALAHPPDLAPHDSMLVHPVATADPVRPTLPPTAGRLGLLRQDRLQHASLSFAIGLGAGIAADEPAASALPVFLGLGKEWLDRRAGGRFDWIDLAAGGIGVGLAALVLLSVDR